LSEQALGDGEHAGKVLCGCCETLEREKIVVRCVCVRVCASNEQREKASHTYIIYT
jgi:hypothetical protein